MTEPAFPRHVVVDAVRKLFDWRRPETVVTEAPRDRAQAQVAVPSISDAAAISNAISAGRLQLIGLARVKSKMGKHWPHLAERVHHVAENVIKKNVLPGDVYQRHGDDGFLILFPRLAPEDALFKANAIAREIEEKLIGSNLSEVSACNAEILAVDLAKAVSGGRPD